MTARKVRILAKTPTHRSFSATCYLSLPPKVERRQRDRRSPPHAPTGTGVLPGHGPALSALPRGDLPRHTGAETSSLQRPLSVRQPLAQNVGNGDLTPCASASVANNGALRKTRDRHIIKKNLENRPASLQDLPMTAPFLLVNFRPSSPFKHSPELETLNTKAFRLPNSLPMISDSLKPATDGPPTPC